MSIVKIDLLSEEVIELKKQIKELYLENNDKKISLGFSGGKDSSCTLAITLSALLEIPKDKLHKKLYVLYSDTLMELLPVQAHTYQVLENIKSFALEHDLPIEVMHAKPKLEETMWSMMIGKGIRPPSRDYRWCTTRLKTNVQEDMLFETFGTKDIETVSIVGSRKDESVDRAVRLTKNTLKGHLKQHSAFPKSLVFAPIEDFSTTDVWNTLRSSKIGREILDAEELFVLYASTEGEGEECATILGNANENGTNPGCSSSQGRFGCWNCGLQYKKDRALVGMQKHHHYIKYLIEFRDWSVSIRDGQWDKYRDFYNHKNFTHLSYNFDNHRFGSSGPGGMSVSTRKETLKRLLYAESKVNESVDFKLISDEELDYCQHLWIQEGDFNLSAMEIAEEYGRSISITEEDKMLIVFARVFYNTMSVWRAKVAYWFNIYADERFCVQFVKQIKEKYSEKTLRNIINKINRTADATIVPDYLKNIQLAKQFYPSDSMKKMILREWRDDKVSYVTQALSNDYEDAWDTDEEIHDPIENPNVSMEDKFAILDNWNTYIGSDSNNRVEHPEYMRFGGYFQYVKFRERQSEENKAAKQAKKEEKRMKKIAKISIPQQTFLFAS